MSTETKTRRPMPAAVTLTSAAEERVAEMMRNAPEGTVGVKLSTPRRGCSGLAYSVDYVSEANAFDERIETPGGTFFIDGGSVLYLVGSTMDWQEDEFTAALCSTTPMPPAVAVAARALRYKPDASRRVVHISRRHT